MLLHSATKNSLKHALCHTRRFPMNRSDMPLFRRGSLKKEANVTPKRHDTPCASTMSLWMVMTRLSSHLASSRKLLNGTTCSCVIQVRPDWSSPCDNTTTGAVYEPQSNTSPKLARCVGNERREPPNLVRFHPSLRKQRLGTPCAWI